MLDRFEAFSSGVEKLLYLRNVQSSTVSACIVCLCKQCCCVPSMLWRLRKALELKPDDQEAAAAMSVAQAIFQQTQQQKYSSPDSSVRSTA